MFTKEFFQDPRFQLPAEWWVNGSSSPTEFLRKTYGAYTQAIRGLIPREEGDFSNRMKSVAEMTEEVCAGILHTLKHLKAGRRARAFQIFLEISLTGEKERYGYPIWKIPNDMRLFRARDKPAMNRGEIFHIPFNLRHLVNSQRYSIPGLPCLYLGTSLYACWLELGSPIFSNLYFSRFAFANPESMRIVNFNFNLSDIPDRLKELESLSMSKGVFNLEDGENGNLLGKIVWWPLLAACSLVRKSPSNAFDEEFLMPHLFMEYIRSQRSLHGVYFFSCKSDVHGTKDRPGRINPLLLNLALPARAEDEIDRYCPELSSDFLLTEPLSWQMGSAITQNAMLGDDGTRAGETFRVSRSHDQRYTYSQFHQMEMLTLNHTLGELKSVL